MSVRCGSCGTLSRARAKFCDECGVALDCAGVPAEFKYVTVLFADVVRSMVLAATLELERYREVMGELVSRMAAVVQRYGGGPVDYTGDGVMAMFGAPAALEDHAFRACLAALEIQTEVARLADEVLRRDGVALRLRVGLNSGQVIAGDIGSGALGYTVTGETVGFAQRMESVAPAGGVMISAATARLVENSTVLSAPQWVPVKGADAPVCAYRLFAISGRHAEKLTEARIVGRGGEMALLEAMLDRAVGGCGGVVDISGSPGIGKSRLVREAAAMAAARGVEVFWSFCESHTVEVPFHAVAQLLRAGSGLADSEGDAARKRLRNGIPSSIDMQDLLLLEDLLGIADPNVERPQIDPEARRRRLTGLINTASMARTSPALYVIEDAHWIDAVSESMLADFLAVVPHTPSLVLITARPEYSGKLAAVPDAARIALAPLAGADLADLLTELLGSDPSVAGLAAVIAERASGNPFFVEEMVRELAARGVLTGARGDYVCAVDIEEVTVPATVKAAIEARIDRLSPPAKRTLSAASVIGARFRADLLVALGIDPVFDELCRVDLVDEIRLTPGAEYMFRHPLVRTVAYEAQLKSDRAVWHRRLAAAIEDSAADSVEESAALIAEHLQSAGESHAAYNWHMRAAAWSAGRDLGAARVSWERARQVADGLSDRDPAALPLRIAPRTMLCATEWQAMRESQGRQFEELRELCTRAGDKFSLAIGMTGPMSELMYTGRSSAAAPLAAEQLELLESIGDPGATVGLVLVPICIWFDIGDFGQVLRWSQTAIDLAAGDTAMGSGFGFGSPLAAALVWRSVARWWLGRSGWREDIEAALDMARATDPTTFAAIVTWSCSSLHYGVLPTDDSALGLVEEAVRTAEGASNVGVTLITFTLGVALLNRYDTDSRARGLQVMSQAREMFLGEAAPFLVTVADLWMAREHFRTGDVDRSLEAMRNGVDDLRRAGRIYYGLWGASLLVQSLAERGHAEDVNEARRVTEVWASLVDDDEAIPRITLLRMRALLARLAGDDRAVGDLVTRYRREAESLGVDSDPAWIADITSTVRPLV